MDAGSRGMSNSVLLIALLLLFAAEPFFLGEQRAGGVFDVIVTAVLVAAVWSVSRRPALLVAGIVLAVPALVARWLLALTGATDLTLAGLVSAMALLAFTAVVLLRQALTEQMVSANTICGAVCVYLLLGVIWGLAFSLMERLHPGSFQLANGDPLGSFAGHALFVPELLYLSLVTLSTVGYGDIVPVTPQARMLAALEAMGGQLYLAVLIARLVGLHVPRK